MVLGPRVCSGKPNPHATASYSLWRLAYKTNVKQWYNLTQIKREITGQPSYDFVLWFWTRSRIVFGSNHNIKHVYFIRISLFALQVSEQCKN